MRDLHFLLKPRLRGQMTHSTDRRAKHTTVAIHSETIVRTKHRAKHRLVFIHVRAAVGGKQYVGVTGQLPFAKRIVTVETQDRMCISRIIRRIGGIPGILGIIRIRIGLLIATLRARARATGRFKIVFIRLIHLCPFIIVLIVVYGEIIRIVSIQTGNQWVAEGVARGAAGYIRSVQGAFGALIVSFGVGAGQIEQRTGHAPQWQPEITRPSVESSKDRKR